MRKHATEVANPQGLLAPPRRLTLWPLIATIFFCVSGGPFGLEPVMQSGAWIALLLILVTPIIWAVPVVLMTAELTSAIPEEGGYYIWVLRALGPFPAFLCAWWSWIYSWLDAAIQPTLFFAYLNGLVTIAAHSSGLEVHAWIKWLVGLLLIGPSTVLNIRGTRSVGHTAFVLGIALLIPFALMIGLGFPHALAHPPHDTFEHGRYAQQTIGAGLFLVMWNYLGWDSMSTIAGEVRHPRSAFPKALVYSAIIITLSYALSAYVGIANVPDLSKWTEGSWTQIAGVIGGTGLAIAMTCGGVISTAGQFSSTLLSGSRVPFVLAEQGYLPPGLTKLHPRYGTPVIAILVSAFFTTILSYQKFEDLAEADVLLYSAGLVLEFVALVVLRRREPQLDRPFRIPGGSIAVVAVATVPTALIVIAVIALITTQEPLAVAGVAIGIASAFAAYPVCARYKRRLTS